MSSSSWVYRHNCLCVHCRRTFSDYLAKRFTPEQLHERFAIDNLAKHVFPEIIAWHDPKVRAQGLSMKNRCPWKEPG